MFHPYKLSCFLMVRCQPDKIVLAGNYHERCYSCPYVQAGITVCVSEIMEISWVKTLFQGMILPENSVIFTLE